MGSFSRSSFAMITSHSFESTNRTILALPCLHSENVPVNRGLLNPPAAADLNCRNLSALHEIVQAREREVQVIGCLFYSKQIVIRRFSHSLMLRVEKQRGNNAICRRFVRRIRDVIGCCQSEECLHVRVVRLMSQRIPEED